MENLIRKTTIVFSQPFTFPGFGETLPAGDYDIETELLAPPDHVKPERWKASVLVHLQPRKSYPGTARSLTVSLADLDRARAKDKLSGKELGEFFLEEMLADPMIRLVMQADGVSEAQIRRLYANPFASAPDIVPDRAHARRTPIDRARDLSAIRSAENEGMPTREE